MKIFPLPLPKLAQIVGLPKCSWSGAMRIDRGLEPDHLLSIIMSAVHVTGFSYIIFLVGYNRGIRKELYTEKRQEITAQDQRFAVPESVFRRFLKS